jgi:hypothetical protein
MTMRMMVKMKSFCGRFARKRKSRSVTGAAQIL